MSAALWVLVGIVVGVVLATVIYMRRIIRLDADVINVINTPARSASVDALIESALGHKPLPRGSTIHDIPHQGGARHRADDEEPLTLATTWPERPDPKQRAE